MRRLVIVAALWSVLLAGCSEAHSTSSKPLPGSPDAAADGTGGTSACDVVTAQHALAPGFHVEACSAIEYATNPPSSGSHYGVWAAFDQYDFPVPRGFWVHSLEHGAVVITYNCPAGCSDEVADAKTFIDSLPVDPLCASSPVDRRVILTPDPLLDVRWAASAWGFTLRAGCFDAKAFEKFYLDHHGKAPEDFCTNGAIFNSADDIPDGCGG